MIIRPLMAADLDRVLAINIANVPAVGAIDHGQLAALVQQGAISLVAEDAGGVVGFCIVLVDGADYGSVNYRWFMDNDPAAAYLDRIAFDSSVVGRGYGTAMFEEVDGRLRRAYPDVSALTLEVNIDPPNEPSLAFHRRLGFTEVGRQMSHGIEVSLMRRDQ